MPCLCLCRLCLCHSEVTSFAVDEKIGFDGYLNILLRMYFSLQFSFKIESFWLLGGRAKKFLVRVRLLQAHSSWHVAVSDAGGVWARAAPDERRPTGVRRARSDQEVGEARSGKGSREVVLNTFLIFQRDDRGVYEADKSIGPW